MKKLLKKSMLFVLLSSVVALGAVNVYAEHHDNEKHVVNADSNGDGKVSMDEFKAARMQHIESHFKRVDANGDGFIDEAEKQDVKHKWREHRKERCEKKHD